MIYIIWLVVLLMVVVQYFRDGYSRFRKRGVKQLTYLTPAGSKIWMLLKLEHYHTTIERIYEMFPGERFVRIFEFATESIMIRDTELVKDVIVRHFNHFVDHRTVMHPEFNPMLNKGLFFLKGQEWRDMRSTLTPSFTITKIRLMMPFMMDAGDQMKIMIEKKIKESEVKYVDIDCKDLCSRFANDVIASCAFGIKTDSHKELDNEFYRMSKVMSTVSHRQIFILLLYRLFPNLLKIFKLKYLNDSVTNFFNSIVLDTMKNRELHRIYRPDMIQFLMKIRKEQSSHEDKRAVDSDVSKIVRKREWTDDTIVAQALLFLLAGYETVSTAMIFLLYELAVNPDVQDRVVAEIREHEMKNNGLDLDFLQHLPYLDMVISESLRLWPVEPYLDRVCMKDYNLGKPNAAAKENYIIRKGTRIKIPISGFQRDPENFPDPLKFNPDRFSKENKSGINCCTYIPFGDGPRGCIGKRFALCEIKVMVYQLLRHFEVSPCERTCIPPVLDTTKYNIALKGGNWLRFKIRQLEL